MADTLTVWTGREDGGHHRYYLRPGGRFTSTRLPAGIDLKVHGYCILPPSPHPVSGAPYRWELHYPAPLPARLRDLLRPLPPLPRPSFVASSNPDALIRFVSHLSPGERNRGTYWAACRAVEGGTLARIAPDLVTAAIETGLSEREALRIVQSAARSSGVRR